MMATAGSCVCPARWPVPSFRPGILNCGSPQARRRCRQGDRLFRNRRDGTLEDVTESAKLPGSQGYGHGVTVGDYDNWIAAPPVRHPLGGRMPSTIIAGMATEDVTASAGLSGERRLANLGSFCRPR